MKTFNMSRVIKYTGECRNCGKWYDCSKKPTDKKFKCPGCGETSKIKFKGE